jgi:hypothetical protein
MPGQPWSCPDIRLERPFDAASWIPPTNAAGAPAWPNNEKLSEYILVSPRNKFIVSRPFRRLIEDHVEAFVDFARIEQGELIVHGKIDGAAADLFD